MLVLYLLARWLPGVWRPVGARWAIVGVMAVYAILGTKDYLSWNGAVAQAKREVLAQTGWSRTQLTAGHAQDQWDTRGRFYATRPDVFFAWGAIPGYTAVDTFTYTRLLPGRGVFYLLREE